MPPTIPAVYEIAVGLPQGGHKGRPYGLYQSAIDNR